MPSPTSTWWSYGEGGTPDEGFMGSDDNEAGTDEANFEEDAEYVFGN